MLAYYVIHAFDKVSNNTSLNTSNNESKASRSSFQQNIQHPQCQDVQQQDIRKNRKNQQIVNIARVRINIASICVYLAILILFATNMSAASTCPFVGIDVPTPSCPDYGFSATLRTNGWMINGIIAIAIAFVAVGIVYALSNVFNSTELRAWSLNEFWQAFATAIVVLCVFIISNIEIQAMEALGYSPSAGPVAGSTNTVIANAHAFLEKTWCYAFGSSAAAIAGYSAFVGIFRKHELETGKKPTSVLWGVASVRLKNTISDSISGIIGKLFGYIIAPLTAVIGVTTIQMFVLCAVDAIAMTILLPLGVVLRSIPFCRGIGTAFIAIAIGFYLIYPLTLLLNEKIVVAVTGDDTWYEKAIPPSAAAYFGVSVLSSIGQFSEASARVFGNHLFIGISKALNKLNLVGFYISFSSIIDLLFFLLERAAFVVVVLGAFLPFLAIVITFGVTRGLANILGSDINLNTLLKIL